MSITDQLSSMMHDDRIVSLDLRYTDFLNALFDIHDESMRDRCHKYWTSLYQYFDHSMTNERALLLEEKRTHEILHRLDIEMALRQSEIAYQVRDILQRGCQVLADLHIKYDRKKNSLTEIEQNIDDLENRIQKQKSERNVITVFNTVSSSTSLYQMTGTINNLQLQIKNLQITREKFQKERNIERANFFSTKINVYHIQQNIYNAEKELIEIQHELTLNLKAIHEQNNQLNQLKQNISISINQEYWNINHQPIKEQINNEQKILFELKRQNKEFNTTLFYHITILKTNENKQKQLNMNNQDLIKVICMKQEQIEKERKIKQDSAQILTELKIKLKRKRKLLAIYHRQENKLKNQIIELEYNRDECLQHTTIHIHENTNQLTNNITKAIRQEVNHRIKLTIIHYNLKHQINTLENTTQQYALIVKEQRQKVINYEKLHDKWIIHININRNRLLELFNKINIIKQCMINTKDFLQQFDHIKLSLRPKILIIYNQMNLFIQQRREKNDDDANITMTNEGKSSLNQMKKILHSNQTIFYQIEENISLVNKNYSILLNQISTVNKQRFHLTQHIDFIHNKYFVEQQQVLSIVNKYNHIKRIIDLNNHKLQRFLLEKQKIIFFLLKKQHLIVLISEHIEVNDKILTKHRSCYDNLMNKIREVRNQILHETQQIKSFGRQHQPDMKQLILRLRTELLKYKKKNNDFQHRINRHHITRQILTHVDDKSIAKENNEQYRINLQKKASLIIYRLICKTHYNIILHKRLDLLMQNISLLYYTDQQPLKNSYVFHLNNSYHLNNQLKAYIAELRVLKNETLVYKQTYINIKHSLKGYFLI